MYLSLNPFHIAKALPIGKVRFWILPMLNHDLIIGKGTAKALGITFWIPCTLTYPSIHMKPTYDDSHDFKMLGDEFSSCLNLSYEPLVALLIDGNKKQEPHIIRKLATNHLQTMLFEEWPAIFLCETENDLVQARKQKFVQLGSELSNDKKVKAKWDKEWEYLQPYIVSGDSYDYGLWKDNPLTVKFKSEFPDGGKPVKLPPIPQTNDIQTKLKQKL